MTVLNLRGRFGRYLNNALTISDFFVVNVVFAIVVLLNPGAWSVGARLIGILVNVAYLPSAFSLHDVRNIRTVHMDRIISNALAAVGLHALVFFSLLFFLNVVTYDWSVYAEFYLGCFVLLPSWWMASRMLVKAYRRHGRNFKRVAIVGTGAAAQRLYEEMTNDAGFGYRVLGFFDYEQPATIPGIYSGAIDTLEDFVKDKCVDQIFFALPGDDEEALRTAINAADANMAQLYIVPQMSRYIHRPLELESVGVVPVMSFRNNPLNNVLARSSKRAFDILFSGTLLLLSPLVYIPVAIAIKVSSPGPVFFKQRRTGYKGREFTCWKFRTMRINAESDHLQASKHDPRKTRVGDFLRRTSIDELPQFLNVFLGDMSVVGPRPHMLVHTEQYSRLIDKYMVRHLIRPGITGWAQVNGLRGQTEQLWQMERRVEFDTWYIENWNFFLDVKIIVRTIINAFHGDEQAF